MTALLAPRPTPDLYLHTVAAQDALRRAVSDLTDELHAIYDDGCDVFLALLDAPTDPALHARYAEIGIQISQQEARIAAAKEGLR